MKEIKLEDLSSLKQKDFNNRIKIIPTYLLDKLKQLELPIKNKELAISQISDFLVYIINVYKNSGKTIIAVSRETFINYFNRNSYKQFKDLLKECNVITAVPYEDGTFYSKENGLSLQYRIHNEFLLATDYTALLFKPNKKEMNLNIIYEGTPKFLHTITKEELDYAKVFKDEIQYHKLNNTSEFSLYSRLVRALALRTERYIKMGIKSNRIYHSFSNLSKITRKCFHTKFNNIDLKNSQPTMLALYLLKNKIQFEESYKLVCEAGKFYELFYDLYNIEDKEILRKTVKVNLYSSVFFYFKEKEESNKRFKELFPLTWKAVKELKDKKLSIASVLQDTEAELFNNLKVKNSSKYFTLFDAIYYNNKKDTEILIERILEYGIRNGIKFTLSCE